MKITIIYDNEVWKKGLEAAWGFSCLVEAYDKTILFDTGGNGRILLGNMKKLQLDPRAVDSIFISHAHADHTGGLYDFLQINPCRIYLPLSCPEPPGGGEAIRVKGPIKIYDNIFSTGELGNVEQSLIIKISSDTVVVAGCSHAGVRQILEKANAHGKVKALIGGLHGFNEFRLVEGLEYICPTHCTQHKNEIKTLYPDKYIEGGAGREINLATQHGLSLY